MSLGPMSDPLNLASVTGTLAAANGGTGITSYTIGDVLFASGATALSKLADVAVGNSLISGGVGVAPAWGKIALTTHVSGILPSANGGTGVNNAGSITNASNTIITGGGTVALGGFTLTVPATGTVVLTTGAQSIAGIKTFTDSPVVSNATPFSSLSRTVGAGNCGFRFLDSTSTFLNWQFAVQFNVSDGWEITPSTVAGGGTYSSPSIIGTSTRITVQHTESASSPIVGGFVVGNGTAGTSVATGAGHIRAGASILSESQTAGIGYATGAGGTVAQATSKATGVTLNRICGQITMQAAALAAGARVSFVVTNSACAATDGPRVWVVSGGTANAYRADITAVAAGSFTVTVENITAGSLSEAPVIGFDIGKSVIA